VIFSSLFSFLSARQVAATSIRFGELEIDPGQFRMHFKSRLARAFGSSKTREQFTPEQLVPNAPQWSTSSSHGDDAQLVIDGDRTTDPAV